MSDGLLYWLNDEVRLSKTVQCISYDFANGFLLGELLSKFNLISAFELFKDSNNKKDVACNYDLLQRAFDELAIHFTDQMRHELIAKQSTKAALLLYKVKQKIAKRLISFDSIMAKGMNKVQTPNKDSPQLQADSRRRRASSQDYQLKRLQSNHRQQIKNSHLSHAHIDKGIIKEVVHEEKPLQVEKQKDKAAISFNIAAKRDKEAVDKDRTYANGWTNQMEIRKIFDYQSKRQMSKTDNLFRQSSNEASISIKAFDENIAKMGIDINLIDPKFTKPQAVNISSHSMIEKIRIKVQSEEIKRKNREKLIQKSNAIKEKQALSNTTSHLRFHASTGDMRKDKAEAVGLNRTSSSLGFLPPLTSRQRKANMEHRSDVFDSKSFFEKLQKENANVRVKHTTLKTSQREMTTSLMKPLMSSIIDLTEECFDYQLNQNSELIELPQWINLIQLFIENSLEKINSLFINSKKAKEEVPQEVNEESPKKENSFIPSSLLKPQSQPPITQYEEEKYLNYLNLIGEFRNDNLKRQVSSLSLSIKDIMGKDIEALIQGKYDLQVTAPLPSSLMPNKQPNAYEPRKEEVEMLQLPPNQPTDVFLGDLLKEIIDYYHTQSNREQKREEDGHNTSNASLKRKELQMLFSSIPIKIAFNGVALSGKQTQAKVIEERYPGIKVYKVDAIIAGLKEKIEMIEAPNDHPKFRTMKKAQIDQYKLDMVQLEEKIRAFIPLIKKCLFEGVSDELRVDILLEQIKADFELKDNQRVVNQIKARNARKEELKEELEKIREEQAKKPKSKTKEELQCQQELDQLEKESYQGFILIDFPKTISQAKLFEAKANPSTVLTEAGKGTHQIEEEQLLMSLQRTIEPKQALKKQSALNLFCFFTLNEPEMTRRALNRKVDPQTGIIYHMTDSPPPDNDKKIKERLIDLTEPTPEQLAVSSKAYMQSYEAMMQFYSSFTLNKKALPTGTSKEECSNSINETLNELIKRHDEGALSYNTQIIDQFENSLTYNFNSNQPKAKLKFIEFKAKFPFAAIQALYLKWKEFIQSYSLHIKSTLLSIQQVEGDLIVQLKQAEAKFIKFLSKKSEKEAIICRFIGRFGTFCELYDAIKSNETVRQEFTHDLEGVTESLWRVINQKKHKAIKEMEHIKSSKVIEASMAQFYSSIERMFILETDKLFTALSILSAFIESKEDLAFGLNIAKELTHELASVPLESGLDENSFPRVDRLYKNCIALLLRYSLLLRHVESHLLKNQEEISTIRKRRTAPKEARGKGLENLQMTDRDNEDDVKCSIKNNISCYKYRITALKSHAEFRLKELRRGGRTLFKAMDNWIVISIKKQNEAMNNAIEGLKQMISSARIAQKGIELDDFSECYDPIAYDFLYKHEAIEDNYINEAFYFCIFFKAIEKMRLYTEAENTITRFTFEEAFFKGFMLNDQTRKLFSKKLQNKDYHDLAVFLKHFVFYSSHKPSSITNQVDVVPEEFIRMNDVFTLLFLIHCKKLTNEEGDRLMEDVASKLTRRSLMKKDEFLSQPLWFEEDKQYLETFIKPPEEDKRKAIVNKEIEIRRCLFEINKINEEELNYANFIQICLLNTLSSPKEAIQHISKYEQLFNAE